MRELDVLAWMEGLTFNPCIERASLDWPPENPYHVIVADREGNITHDSLENLDRVEAGDA